MAHYQKRLMVLKRKAIHWILIFVKVILACHHGNAILSPDDFEIDKIYRFEGESNPDDQAILYAISSPKFGVKGLLVNVYGISTDEASAALVAKLKTHLDNLL